MSYARIAVIGCGQWGKNLIRVLSEIGNLVAVCDIHYELAERIALQYNVLVMHVDEIYRNPDIDGVVIAAPASQHAVLTKQALQNGKHVFVEKPLALNIDDTLISHELSQQLKRVFMVGHLLQYHPAYRKLKQLVQNSIIGNVRYIYSKRLSLGRIESPANVSWSLAPHDISMILGIVGEFPQSIDAEGTAILNPQIEDVVMINMVFKNDIKAHIHVSWLHPFKENCITIIGETGMLVFDDVQPWEKKLQLYPHKVKRTNNKMEIEKAEVIYYPVEALEPLKQECLHFIECIKSNSTPETDGYEGARVVRVLDAVQHSLDARKSSQVDYHKLPHYQHETAIVDEGCKIGSGTKIWHFSHLLKGTIIGDDCIVGQNVMIGPDVTIGNRCKIQNNVSLYNGVTLEDFVFCGPSCVFTNDYIPRAEIYRKDEFRKTFVERGASIGANATIVCGVRLGAYCLIGAGSVIIRDVKPHALMVGNPGRQIGWISHSGEKLGPDLVCSRERRRYRITESNTLEEITGHACLESEKCCISRRIEFIDLQMQQKHIRSQIDAAIKRVLDHGGYIMGPEVFEFENLMSKFCGVKHAISCSNGTDALALGLMAQAVGPGHAIFLPSFTYAATAEAVAWTGATIVFIDSLSNTFNMDPKSLENGIQTALKHGITPKGIIPVDLFGQPADYDAIESIANRYSLWIMCDAAQSFGASYKNLKVGNIGDMTATSFYPAKPLGCYGDGGAIFTNDDKLASIIKSLRVHGQGVDKYENIRIGMNGRLDTIQAAILIEKLKAFPDELTARQKTADLYNSLLEDFVQVPYNLPQTTSAWAQYTIALPRHVNRNNLMEILNTEGIPTTVYYMKPMHMQKAYAHYLTAGDSSLSVCEEMSNCVLSLPMSGYVSDHDVQHICEVLKRHIKP